MDEEGHDEKKELEWIKTIPTYQLGYFVGKEGKDRHFIKIAGLWPNAKNTCHKTNVLKLETHIPEGTVLYLLKVDPSRWAKKGDDTKLDVSNFL